MTPEEKQARLSAIEAELKQLDWAATELRSKGPDAVGLGAFLLELRRISALAIALTNEALLLWAADADVPLPAHDDAESLTQSRFEALTAPEEAPNVGLLSDRNLVAFGRWCMARGVDKTLPDRRRYVAAVNLVDGLVFDRFDALVNAKKEVARG